MIGATRYFSTAEINRQTKLSNDIAKLSQSVSTGKRLSVASDDPTAASRIADIGLTQANQAAYEKNIDTGSTIASAVDTQLVSVQNALTRAKELVINARTGSSSTTDRTTMATELQGILEDINSYANSTDPNGNALFPTGTPTAIPISDSVSLSATASQSTVFGGVTTASGTRSISDILTSAITAMQTGDTSGMSTSLTDLDSSIDHVTTQQTQQGLREQRFTNMKDALQSRDTDLAAERTGLEDTDLTYALTEIQSKQLSLQAAQTVFAQTNKSNLFSLLG